MSLDSIHHIAICVKDISESVEYYSNNFNCEIEYQDNSWAFLKFANTYLALVLPDQHPAHIAFPVQDASKFGTPKLHRDGTSSVYHKDPSNNAIEYIQLK
ncbi:MAG: VOC family protein [Lentisphaeria bacterium]|nr:VOC family protein [Lentisphaeria bacterium]